MGIESALRLVRRVQIAMLVSIALFFAVGERLARRPTHEPENTLFHALSLISISLVGATMVVRRTLISPSEEAVKQRSDDEVAVARWRASYFWLFALCEALGFFGLVLRLSGFPLANVWGFYLGGFLLLLLYSPRVPQLRSR
jgi:hypothetical protein